MIVGKQSMGEELRHVQCKWAGEASTRV